jgi:pimeloyl-ACP methyl ester carboxylesterase
MSVSKPSIVFAHGLWADGSCFSKLIPSLQAEGHEVIASGHGLDSLEGDVDCLIRSIGRVKPPVILVGHSYGGTLITHAGCDDRVAGLVYLAALAPDEGESSQAQQDKFPRSRIFDFIEVADNRIWLLQDGVGFFCGDLSEEEQQLVWATAMAPAADVFAHPYPGAAWKTKPCWYVVAANDNTINPELQRFVASQMNATIYEIQSSHVLMLSHSETVLDVIRSAAAACQ